MLQSLTSVRALLVVGVFVSGASLVAPSVSAATLSVSDGTATYKCTLGKLSVNSAGNVDATVSACSPTLGGSGGGNTGGGDDGGGNTGGGDDGGGNSGGGTGGGTGGGADPGSGLWSPDPAAKPVIYVVDQSLNEGLPTNITRLAGCLNGGSIHNGSVCTEASVYNGKLDGKSVAVRLTAGQIVSIRYRPSTVVGSNTGYFNLTNSVGGNIGSNTTMSLSTTPGDMNPANSKCVTTADSTPLLSTGSSFCPVSSANSVYYLNIRVNQDCSTCNWRIEERSKSFLN